MDRSLFRIDSSTSCRIDGCSCLRNDISQYGNAVSPIPRVATSDIDDSFVNDNITCTVEDTCRRGRMSSYIGIDYDGSINYSYTSISRCGLYRIIDCQICLCSNSNIGRGNDKRCTDSSRCDIYCIPFRIVEGQNITTTYCKGIISTDTL